MINVQKYWPPAIRPFIEFVVLVVAVLMFPLKGVLFEIGIKNVAKGLDLKMSVVFCSSFVSFKPFSTSKPDSFNTKNKK